MQELKDWESWNSTSSGVSTSKEVLIKWIVYFFSKYCLIQEGGDGMVSVSMLIWSQFRCRYLKVFSAFLLWSRNRIICYWNSRGRHRQPAFFMHQTFVLQMMHKNKSKNSHYPFATYKGSYEPKAEVHWIQSKLEVPCSHLRLWALCLGTNAF